MIAHALAEAPNECCGILTGAGDTVRHVHRATNTDRSPVKYTIDGRDTLRITRAAEAAGQEIVAFYHSHTFTEAYPSVTDISKVPPPGLFDHLYVIVSLAERGKPVIRAFRIVNKLAGQKVVNERVEELPVEIAS
jgi:proteasome lid subunit RPN8/RPN11